MISFVRVPSFSRNFAPMSRYFTLVPSATLLAISLAFAFFSRCGLGLSPRGNMPKMSTFAFGLSLSVATILLMPAPISSPVLSAPLLLFCADHEDDELDVVLRVAHRFEQAADQLPQDVLCAITADAQVHAVHWAPMSFLPNALARTPPALRNGIAQES